MQDLPAPPHPRLDLQGTKAGLDLRSQELRKRNRELQARSFGAETCHRGHHMATWRFMPVAAHYERDILGQYLALDAHGHTHMYIRMSKSKCICIETCMHARARTDETSDAYTYLYVHTRLDTYVYIYIYIYTCAYTVPRYTLWHGFFMVYGLELPYVVWQDQAEQITRTWPIAPDAQWPSVGGEGRTHIILTPML